MDVEEEFSGGPVFFIRSVMDSYTCGPHMGLITNILFMSQKLHQPFVVYIFPTYCMLFLQVTQQTPRRNRLSLWFRQRERSNILSSILERIEGTSLISC